MNFDEPDAEWTDEYDWARYRGPQPYPTPGGWVLGTPEVLACGWYCYPDIGPNHGLNDEVREAFGKNDDGYNDARSGRAMLIGDPVDDAREETIKWEFTVDGETVFESVDPDDENLWSVVAEVLQRHSDGREYSDCEPPSGRPPGLTEAERKERETEQRKQNNASLGDFE